MRWSWLGWSLGVVVAAAAAAQPRVLDDFSSVAAWRVIASDGVKMSIAADVSDGRPAMRVDYEFVSGAGFGVVQRDLAMDLPENYEFSVGMRADSPNNDLEFKLLDAPKGESVWWCKKRAFEFPRDHTVLRYRKRDVSFAWGPSGGKPLGSISKLEFAVASSSGGKGTLWLDALTFRELPPVRPYTGTPSVTVTTEAAGHPAANVLDGDAASTWRSRGDDGGPTATIDFGAVREFGGLTITWDPQRPPHGVDIDLSADGELWTPACTLLAERLAPRSAVPLPDAEARFVRLTMTAGTGEGVGIAAVRVEPLEFGRSLTDTWKAIAADSPRGWFPRYFTGEQSFWTVTGTPGDGHEVLINEEGMVEIAKSGPSLEPFILNEDGRLITWAESRNTQRLGASGLVVPVVERHADGLLLSITAAPMRDGSEKPSIAVRYKLVNTESRSRAVRLFVALRPFQVNAPWQFLNTPGGAAAVETLRVDDGRDVVVNSSTLVTFAPAPDDIGAAAFAEGEVVALIGAGRVPKSKLVSDQRGKGASAVSEYTISLSPGESQELWARIMPGCDRRPEELRGEDSAAMVKRMQTGVMAASDHWRSVLKKYQINLPDSAAGLNESIQANLGYILVNMDGPGFQPGSRSYERSWIRDGSMTGAACLEFGLRDEPRRFVEWYGGHQFPSGKVPCVVDHRGPDPVPENDSHGQLIYAIAENYRFNHDADWLRTQLPRVRAAVKYIEDLRAQRMTPEFKQAGTTRQEPGKAAVPVTAFYGLVPESISHEGYSAKPMHSYWDQFFVLKGLKDAAYIARALGEPDLAKQWGDLAADFRTCLVNSVGASMAAHGIDYIPGCVELGDFDATSTAVAVTVCGEMNALPRAWLDATFDRYWANFVKRRDDPTFEWVDYTPYELRVVGAMVMLGHRDRAMQMLDWFMNDQHPAGWHHWAEIVHKDRKAGKWIGDMPHTWVGSDFLRSVRSMFVYEDGPGDGIVLLAGVPQAWLDSEKGVSFELPTHFGKLTVQAKSAADGSTRVTVESDGPAPADMWVRPPSLSSPDKVRVNGKQPEVRNGTFRVDTLPASIVYIR